jgi:energy-coupling factor transport system substrate-specific component
MKSRLFSLLIYLAATLSGAMVLLYPFFLPILSLRPGYGTFRAGEMPAMMTLLLGLCLLVLIIEAQGKLMNTKLIALLGVLVAINSALRFIETALPGPGGFTPIFFLIILVGYVFGGRIGFLMGALTMFVSALVTGGVGPWLPGQMFTAGWVGMSAVLLTFLIQPLKLKMEQKKSSRINPETLVLAIFGLLWGFLYGAIMNLWQWPFIMGVQGQSWRVGLGFTETIRHYLAYYLVTSMIWDTIAAIGNLFLILAFGAATLKALRRFKKRFIFTYIPEGESLSKTISEGTTG